MICVVFAFMVFFTAWLFVGLTLLAAFLQTLPTGDDPAVQAQIDGFTTQLGDMDTSLQAMDASLKPAA